MKPLIAVLLLIVTFSARLIHARCVWTRYYDRDDPTGTGDHETLHLLRRDYPGEICPDPIAINARVVGFNTTVGVGGQVVTSNILEGFRCLNSQQPGGRRCFDYEVRFCCPRPPPCRWTRYYDRDNPGGVGDFETLTHLRNENPGQICPNPIRVQARTVPGGVDSSLTGEIVTLSTTHGFSCVNRNQRDRRCMDYEVRFCCPILPPCRWTPYFDRDDPNGIGDFENFQLILNQYPRRLCRNPVGVEAVTVGTNIPWHATGEVVSLTLEDGLVCRNADQPDARCMDYAVRFCCPLRPCRWTRYYDRDNPLPGSGDDERLSLIRNQYPGQICPRPIAFNARTVGSMIDYTATGEVVTASASFGLRCFNRQQRDRRCMDYEIRFCCPVRPPCRWTRYYDRDNPGGVGDFETLIHLRNENPGQICPNPIQVQARTVPGGVDSSLTGEIVTLSTTHGFSCVNRNQRDGRCMDYEVRFCCRFRIRPISIGTPLQIANTTVG